MKRADVEFVNEKGLSNRTLRLHIDRVEQLSKDKSRRIGMEIGESLVELSMETSINHDVFD